MVLPVSMFGGNRCAVGTDDWLGGVCDPGTLAFAPFARHMQSFEVGDLFYGVNEVTAIRKFQARAERTKVYVKAPGDDLDLFAVQAVARVWRGGVLKAVVDPFNASVPAACVAAGGGVDCPVWQVGEFDHFGNFFTTNTIGDGEDIPGATSFATTFGGR